MGSDLKERLLARHHDGLHLTVFGSDYVNPDGREAAARITELEAALSAATAKVSRYEARLEIDHCFKLVGEDLVREEIPAEDRERFPDGILARDETIKLLERRVEAAERDSAKYRDYAAEKSNQYVQNLHELEMLKADFNDCNSERARHKAAREAAEAEAARLREAIHAVQDATAAYLPPDGIGAQECLNRILQATDNPFAALTAAGWTLAPPGSRVVPEGGEWQPIETAPFTFDDGRRWLTWCLLWVPDQYGGLAIVGGMNADEWLWRDDERSCAGFQTAPTHWRHLPAPPALRALAGAKP